MAKGIAEINTSDSDELRLKKINTNFKNLVTGEVPVGAISGTGGGYNTMLSRVGTTLSNNDRFVRTLSAYAIDAQYISADTINTDGLATKYAQIDFANITNLTAQQLYSRSGLISELTTESAWNTGLLAAVKIQADSISANMITADKIRFSDGSTWTSAADFVATNKGLLAALNALALGGSDALVAKLEDLGETQTDFQTYDQQLDGSIIMADTIVAEKVKVSDLEAFHATIGGFTINGNDGGLVGNLDQGGILEFRPDGFFHAGSATSYIEVNPETSRVDVICDTTNVKEDITIASLWKWDLTSSGTLNLLYIGQ